MDIEKESSDKTLISYRPPGEIARRFHLDNSFVRGLRGPVGSGKSSSACYDILIRGLQQAPYRGCRKSRWAVIRNTYPELKTTTIRTWLDWFESICVMKYDSPITSTIKVDDIGDGTSLELEVIFIAIDRPEEVGKLKSLELTGGWINEASEIDKSVLDLLTSRVGRFPSKRNGGPTWSGIVMDTNPPDDDHWWYDLAEVTKPKSFRFYSQPGGLYRTEDGEYKRNPEAENILNLPTGYEYYERQLAGKTEEWINVFVLGNYGTTSTGKPVYPEWNDRKHVAESEIVPTRGLPVVLGWDFGLTPACIVGQITPRGRLLVIDELVSEDMGVRQFANDVVKPLLVNKYDGFKIVSTGDPSGEIRVATDTQTCFGELAAAGIPSTPADTNDFIPRRESVAFYLTKMSDGETAFLLSPTCQILRRGFNGKYQLERLKTSGPARYKDRPKKDEFSHPHDALQYLCMKVRSGLNPIKARKVQKVDMKAYT